MISQLLTLLYHGIRGCQEIQYIDIVDK